MHTNNLRFAAAIESLLTALSIDNEDKNTRYALALAYGAFVTSHFPRDITHCSFYCSSGEVQSAEKAIESIVDEGLSLAIVHF